MLGWAIMVACMAWMLAAGCTGWENQVMPVCLVPVCSYGPGEEDGATGGISSENKPRIVLMGLRRCVSMGGSMCQCVV